VKSGAQVSAPRRTRLQVRVRALLILDGRSERDVARQPAGVVNHLLDVPGPLRQQQIDQPRGLGDEIEQVAPPPARHAVVRTRPRATTQKTSDRNARERARAGST